MLITLFTLFCSEKYNQAKYEIGSITDILLKSQKIEEYFNEGKNIINLDNTNKLDSFINGIPYNDFSSIRIGLIVHAYNHNKYDSLEFLYKSQVHIDDLLFYALDINSLHKEKEKYENLVETQKNNKYCEIIRTIILYNLDKFLILWAFAETKDENNLIDLISLIESQLDTSLLKKAIDSIMTIEINQIGNLSLEKRKLAKEFLEKIAKLYEVSDEESITESEGGSGEEFESTDNDSISSAPKSDNELIGNTESDTESDEKFYNESINNKNSKNNNNSLSSFIRKLCCCCKRKNKELSDKTLLLQ